MALKIVVLCVVAILVMLGVALIGFIAWCYCLACWIVDEFERR